MTFDYSQTYLYKLHKLTNLLDKIFDQNLRRHADIGLSQFTLLLSIAQHQPTTQRTIADFLDLSAGAISRQVEIAQQNGQITVEGGVDRRAQSLNITKSGQSKINSGIAVLEKHVFSIFSDENVQTNLMQHIDLLQSNVNDLNKK
jgi:DNA-binding MarR family transcriptional regulator